jgi:hypothetical protein
LIRQAGAATNDANAAVADVGDTSSIASPPVAAAARAMTVQHRDNLVAFRINNEDYADHAFPIGGWNAVGQSSEASATNRERSTDTAYERTAVGIDINNLQNSYRNASRLRSLACVIGQDQRGYALCIVCVHGPVLPVATRNAAFDCRDGGHLFLAPTRTDTSARPGTCADLNRGAHWGLRTRFCRYPCRGNQAFAARVR